MDEPEVHETTQETQPKQWRFTILHSFALIVLFGVLQLWIYFVIQRVTGLKLEDLRWYHLCLQNGISGGITLAVGAYMNGFSLQSMLFDRLPNASAVFAALLSILGIAILSSELNNLLHLFIPVSSETKIFDKFMQEDIAGVFITVLVVAPLVEEMLFRGIILDGLRMHYKLATAVLVSSILFGLVHIDLFIAVNAFLLALFLAWMRLESGSLMLCVVSHATFNSIPFILVRILKMEIRGFTTISSNVVQFQPLWFDALGLLLLAIGIAGLKTLNHEEHEVHEGHEM